MKDFLKGKKHVLQTKRDHKLIFQQSEKKETKDVLPIKHREVGSSYSKKL